MERASPKSWCTSHRPPPGARSAQAGRAGGGQRSHPHGGHAQPRRGGGRRGCATHRRAEHRVRVPADRHGPQAGGRSTLGRRPMAVERSVEALHELEDAVTKTEGIEGWCCGTGSSTAPARRTGRAGSSPRGPPPSFPDRRRLRRVLVHPRRRRADATVAAVERGAPGIYNVVDDEPAPWRDWLPVYAERDRGEATVAGAALPGADPGGGEYGVMLATDLRRASNENAQGRARLGATPRESGGRGSGTSLVGE